MKLTYQPEGSSEPTVWTFALGKLRVKEQKVIEKATGMAFGSEFKVALLKGNATARQALLWLFLQRAHDKLKLDEVDFCDDELELEQGAAEWQESYDQLVKMPQVPNLSDEEREGVLLMMQAEIAAAREAEGLNDMPEREPVGKEDSASAPPTS
jgi:hypothetical protein